MGPGRDPETRKVFNYEKPLINDPKVFNFCANMQAQKSLIFAAI